LLGRYLTEIKNFEKASKHLNDALKIFVGLKERLNVGKVYYYMGKRASAICNKSIYQKHLNKSLKIFESLGAKGWQEKVKKTLKESSKK